MAKPTEETMQLFKDIKAKKYRYLTFEIKDMSEIIIDKKGDRKESDHKQFRKQALPDTRCRYAIYDLEFKTNDNRQTSKLYFIFWTPKNVNQKDRVLYSEALPGFRDQCAGVTNFSATTMSEVKELLEVEAFEGKKE